MKCILYLNLVWQQVSACLKSIVCVSIGNRWGSSFGVCLGVVAGQRGGKADGHMPHTDLSAAGTVAPTKPEQHQELNLRVDPVKTQNNSVVIPSEWPQWRAMCLINHG